MDANTTPVAFSLRRAARFYGLSRDVFTAAIAKGDLPAARLGLRSYTILNADILDWLRRHTVWPTKPATNNHARQVVERRLEHEARTGT